MLNIIYTSSFKKDYKRVLKQNKKIQVLDEILYSLAHQIPLDAKYRDHSLIGNYKNKRECHISPNWLLIYEVDSNNLVLHRTGSHSNLFNK